MALPVNVKDLLINYFDDNDITIIKNETDITETVINGIISTLESEDLLPEVKNYLDITWDDEATDRKIRGIIERGIKYINKAAGAELDYTVEGKPRELLFDYCRYVRSNALAEFLTNYLHELLSLQIEQEVKAYAEKNTDV